MGNIVLIGFMGVGKGRTARALAEKTGYFAVDTDDLIESKVKNKIRKIFKQEGEPAFRSYEQDVALWLEKQVQKTVVSTGGGFFVVPNLKQIGKIVYLHADVEAIIEAILSHPNAAKKIKKRPLLQDIEAAKKLFATRLPHYRNLADIEIDVQGKAPDQIAEEIIAHLK